MPTKCAIGTQQRTSLVIAHMSHGISLPTGPISMPQLRLSICSLRDQWKSHHFDPIQFILQTTNKTSYTLRATGTLLHNPRKSREIKFNWIIKAIYSNNYYNNKAKNSRQLNGRNWFDVNPHRPTQIDEFTDFSLLFFIYLYFICFLSFSTSLLLLVRKKWKRSPDHTNIIEWIPFE